MPPNYKRSRRTNSPAVPPRGAMVLAPDSELEPLTPQQESFVMALLQGKSNVEAYREAYSPTNPKADWIRTEAARLKHNPRVALALRSFQRMGLDSANLTFESHLSELARLRELAVIEGQISAAVQAEHYRGRAGGMYEERIRLTVGLEDSALLAQLAAILGPEASQAIAAQLGTMPPKRSREPEPYQAIEHDPDSEVDPITAQLAQD